MLVWLQAFIIVALSSFPNIPSTPQAAHVHGQRVDYVDRVFFTRGNLTWEFNLQSHDVVNVANITTFFNNSFLLHCPQQSDVNNVTWCDTVWATGWDGIWRWKTKTYYWQGASYCRANSPGNNFGGSPSSILSGWTGMPTNVDALIEEDAEYNWGFKGNLTWKYSVPGDFTVLSAVPMDTWFPGVPYSPDAGLRHFHIDYLMFFKGSQYWAFDQYSRTALPNFPRSVAGTPGRCEPYQDRSSLAGVITDRLSGGSSPNNYISNMNCNWKVYAPKLYWSGITGELDELFQNEQSNASYVGLSLMFTSFSLGVGDSVAIYDNKDKSAPLTAYHNTANRILAMQLSSSSPPPINVSLSITGAISKSFSINFITNNDPSSLGAGWRAYYWVTNSDQPFTSLLGPMWLTSPYGATNVTALVKPATQTPSLIDFTVFMQMIDDNPARYSEVMINIYIGTNNSVLFASCSMTNHTPTGCPTHEFLPRCACVVTGVPSGSAFVELVAPADVFVNSAMRYIVRSTCTGLQNFTAINGSITDGSRSLFYFSSQNCRWFISNANDPEALLVVLTLNSFQTQSDSQGSDPMNIYNRFNATSKYLLKTIVGAPAVPIQVVSDTAEMYITWVSDAVYSQASNLAGFFGSYEIIYLPSPQLTTVTGYENLLASGTTDELHLPVGTVLTLSLFPYDKFHRVVDALYFGATRFAFIYRIVPASIPDNQLAPLLNISYAINSSNTDPAFLALSPELQKLVFDVQPSATNQSLSLPTTPGGYFLYLICRYRNFTSTVLFPAFNGASRLNLTLIPAVGSSTTSSLGSPVNIVSSPTSNTTLLIESGAHASLVITVRDQYANILGRGHSDVRVFAISTSYAIVVPMTDYMNGTYLANLYPLTAASYSMTVLVSGADIPNSPFKLYVLPGQTDPSKTEITISTLGPDGVSEMTQAVFDGKIESSLALASTRLNLPDAPFNITVAVYDKNGNPRNALSDIVSVNFGCGPACGTVTAFALNQTDLPPPDPPSDAIEGVQGARYLFNVIPSRKGAFDVEVFLNEQPTLTKIPILVGQETAPVSWHTVLGVLATIINIVICIVSWVLVTLRRHLPPLKPMSYNLLMLSTLGTLVWAHFPLLQAVGESYPCKLAPWLALLAPVLWCTPLLLAILRLRIYFPFSKLKLRWARRELAFSELVEIQEQRRLFSETRFILFYLGGVLAPLLIIAPISVIFADQAESSNGCAMGSALEGTWAVFGAIYFLLLLIALYEVRNCDETLGFRKEGGRLVIYASLIGLIAVVLRGSTSTSPHKRNDVFFLLWLIPMIYQIRGVLLPALRTLSMFQKTIKQEVTVPLGELLLTSRGFKFFYHFTEAEFSQENPLCFQAIERYRRKTSLASLKDIYEKYFAPGAPLQVNIPFKVVEELRLFVKSANASTPMEQLQCAFDIAQTELLTLMSGDSYRRFLSSSHYEGFQKGAPEPDLDGTYMSQNSSGSNNETNRRDKGNGSTQQVEMSNMDEDHAIRESAPQGDGGDPIITGSSGDALPIIEEKVQLKPAIGSGSMQSSSTTTFEPHEMHEATESYVV
jgi:hypothetical protein